LYALRVAKRAAVLRLGPGRWQVAGRLWWWQTGTAAGDGGVCGCSLQLLAMENGRTGSHLEIQYGGLLRRVQRGQKKRICRKAT
jgi:hypothetical protein